MSDDYCCICATYIVSSGCGCTEMIEDLVKENKEQRESIKYLEAAIATREIRHKKQIADLEAKKSCKWQKSFDGHFNIGCVNETHERANGQFKGDGTTWEFNYCPYCSGKIEVNE